MRTSTVQTNGSVPTRWPSVTVVFLVYNRRDELRVSLRNMVEESDYEGPVDVIVVDNASTDGAAAMVREEFPQVQLIARDRNIGISGWNDGFEVARGEFVLALDDDCYLPPDGLRRAVHAASATGADLVSFKVASTEDPEHEFTEEYRTGLLSFWGCAVLIGQTALRALGGYDPEIFCWAHELEFMLRFFDRGFRHLHLPDVCAQHMKPAFTPPSESVIRMYRMNARNWGYIAAKLLRRRDAAEALVAMLATVVRDGLRFDRRMAKGLSDVVRGYVRGLRHRRPVANAELSRFYRLNFESFASPWWLSRRPSELLRDLPRELVAGKLSYETRPPEEGRRDEYYARRAPYYPTEPAVIEF